MFESGNDVKSRATSETLESRASTLIHDIPSVLTWADASAQIDAIHGGWTKIVDQALTQMLSDLEEARHPYASVIRGGMRALSSESYSRLVYAPETTFRLLWRSASEAAEFVRHAVDAELARSGQPVGVSVDSWTAIGDFVVRPDGETADGPEVAGLAPIDMDSPSARSLDLSGLRYTIGKLRPPMPDMDRAIVLERLSQVAELLPLVSPSTARVVQQFTKVLILQRDDSEPFSSGSNGQFIGRSAISNPHWPNIDAAVLADAIVHEAIHSVLYMQELQHPWVLDDALYDSVPRIVSPWSGNRLPLRPFLQACFVWYGLLNFWALAHVTDNFDRDQVRFLLSRALSGFLKGPLFEELKPYVQSLDTGIVDAVRDMQADVVNCYQGSS